MSLRLLFVLATLWLGIAMPLFADNSSSSIYSDVEASVYQVQVINQQTGKKTAIGSAFVVMRPDIIATNYHVVSTYINNPKGDFALDYLSTSGNTGRLELLAVDVLRDLAVLKADTNLGKPLQIAKIPPKGARLYSLGNPMDKGFSIVEGTNNGIMKSSDDNNILFSGSLNSGMSGGPTLDENKNVVGINVATSGNGLSYLVPADYLAIVLERLKLTGFQADTDIGQRITEQLKNKADKYVQNLQKREWTLQQLGNFKVPMDVTSVVRCWDNSDKPIPGSLMRSYFTQCSNESSIYLDDDLEVGTLDYEYVWLDAGEMIPARFYRHYEAMNVSVSASGAGEQDVTNFECFTDFTLIAGQEFKMTVCRRDYLNYTGLSDLLVTAALVGHKRQGMLFNLDMTGTTFESGMALLEHMLGDFKWQK